MAAKARAATSLVGWHLSPAKLKRALWSGQVGRLLIYRRRRRRRRPFSWWWINLAEALEVTVETGISGTSNTELGTRADLSEAMEVTFEAGIVGTSDTELGTRAELAG